MNTQDVLSLNQRMHDWMQVYDQELEKDIAHYLRKHAVSQPGELKHTLEQLREEGRLLQIGVVGRVKVGKSSLLNALVFGGQNILPRAATPMTAALTTLAYSSTFSAHVQFYSAADLRDIEAVRTDSKSAWPTSGTGLQTSCAGVASIPGWRLKTRRSGSRPARRHAASCRRMHRFAPRTTSGNVFKRAG